MFYAVILLAFGAMTQPWQTPDNWQKLDKTMTDIQVRQTLGNPTQIKQFDAGQVWYYSDTAWVKLKYRAVNGRKALFYSDATPPGIPIRSEELIKIPAAGVPSVSRPITIKPQIPKSTAIPKPVVTVALQQAGKIENGKLKIESPEASASRYFIWVGGGIIAIAAIIAISQGAKLFT
jgi:hypothetical protein